MTDQAVTDADVAEAAAPEPAAPTGRRSLKRKTKIRLLVIGVVALLVTAAFLTYYLIESRTYVTTDNAQVDGNQISITAPTSGILIDWHGQQGTQLQQNAPVGRIEIQGGFMQPQMVIRAPAAGVVAVDNGVPGSFVTAGTQLAIAYDGSGVFITARVDETEIDAVHVGAPVKISVDAFPNADLTGRVSEIKTGGRRGLLALSTVQHLRQLPEGHPSNPSEDHHRRPAEPAAGPRHERHRQDPPRVTT